MTERVGLLGWPVSHSVSPAMHNAAFDALGLDWRYDLLPVRPTEFAGSVARLIKREGYRGFNVTIPHKLAAFALTQVSAFSPGARAIGAVNTLVMGADGAWSADNTDWTGFAADLAALDVPIEGTTCLVLGTGGSSQAVVYALQQYGARRIVQVSRTPGRTAGVIGYGELAQHAPAADLVINCTPVGMSPDTDQSPWPAEVSFPKQAVLYDLVYNPARTALMQQALAAGARAYNGLGMLVRQGALSFEQWTGITPPTEIMTRAALQALGMATSDH